MFIFNFFSLQNKSQWNTFSVCCKITDQTICTNFYFMLRSLNCWFDCWNGENHKLRGYVGYKIEWKFIIRNSYALLFKIALIVGFVCPFTIICNPIIFLDADFLFIFPSRIELQSSCISELLVYKEKRNCIKRLCLCFISIFLFLTYLTLSSVF